MRYFWIKKFFFVFLIQFIQGLGLFMLTFDSHAELPKPYFDQLPISTISGKGIGEVLTDQNQVLWYDADAYLHRYEGEEPSPNNLFSVKYSNPMFQLDQWNRFYSGIVKTQNNQLQYYQLSTGAIGTLSLVDSTNKPIDLNPDQVSITLSKQNIWLLTGEGRFYKGQLTDDLGQQLRLEPISLPVNLNPEDGAVWLGQTYDQIWLANKHHLLS